MNSQKILFDFNRCHFSEKVFSRSQFAASIICGMLVGTVPNKVPDAKPIIPIKKPSINISIGYIKIQRKKKNMLKPREPNIKYGAEL